MKRTRIKICGITRIEDAQHCLELGIDALGLVFVEASQRCIDMPTARRIRDHAGGLMRVVALFADPQPAEVERVLERVHPDLLQFHGDEAPELCSSFGVPWVKALSWQQIAAAERYRDAQAIIIDSHAPGALGGTGRPFDWADVPGDIGRPLILAGGLRPGNIAAAIRAVAPHAIDLSSGVERAPGIKDRSLIEQTIEEVARVDRDRPSKR